MPADVRFVIPHPPKTFLHAISVPPGGAVSSALGGDRCWIGRIIDQTLCRHVDEALEPIRELGW